ncbi:MAG: type I-E CRISPR-associated endoribonuclease Cas2 [Chloroflexi bacterium]|nr:type I-E CRISPR-associated endoribonuclease Cas2 [Chloroflexota bacterium]
MVVLVLERVTPSLRGNLTRWFIEPRAGVFVGNVPARVRDSLWEKITIAVADGAATMIYQTNTEQGFAVRTRGQGSREFVDFEGLWLARWPGHDKALTAKPTS